MPMTTSSSSFIPSCAGSKRWTQAAALSKAGWFGQKEADAVADLRKLLRVLDELAVFHHEVDVAQGLDVLQGVFRRGDDVGLQPRSDGSALVLNLHQLGRVGGHAFQNLCGRDASPARAQLRAESSTGALGVSPPEATTKNWTSEYFEKIPGLGYLAVKE